MTSLLQPDRGSYPNDRHHIFYLLRRVHARARADQHVQRADHGPDERVLGLVAHDRRRCSSSFALIIVPDHHQSVELRLRRRRSTTPASPGHDSGHRIFLLRLRDRLDRDGPVHDHRAMTRRRTWRRRRTRHRARRRLGHGHGRSSSRSSSGSFCWSPSPSRPERHRRSGAGHLHRRPTSGRRR